MIPSDIARHEETVSDAVQDFLDTAINIHHNLAKEIRELNDKLRASEDRVEELERELEMAKIAVENRRVVRAHFGKAA